jgi:predicted nucleotidyltransferase
MAEEYELKQVKVRLKLSEAEPLYSTEQINTPDKAAEVMAQTLAQMDREYCVVVNLDAANHPLNFNVVSIGDINQAQVPIQNVFKSAILSNAASIMLFHNHPSGSTRASREDVDITKRLIEAGKIMNIPVLDHIIVAGGTAEHFSFRKDNPNMFSVMDKTEYSVHEPQRKMNPDNLMVRPTYRNFGVYEKTAINRARVIYEGSEQDCYNKIKELRDRYRENTKGDRFSIYQLKDDEALKDMRFEGLESLKKENKVINRDNYDAVYEARLKPDTTLDDLYFQFNMDRPLDFMGHSLSISDVIVLHKDGEDKAFYVDRFGFTELQNFLSEHKAEKEVETFVDEAAYKLGDRYISIQRTEEGFDYSIFDEDYHLLDEGVYNNSDATIGTVLQELTEVLKQPVYDKERDTYFHTAVQGNIHQKDNAIAVDYDKLMEKTNEVALTGIEAAKLAQKIVEDFRSDTERLFHSEKMDGMRPSDIEETVRELTQQMIDDYEMDAKIEDVIVSGSRSRGLENENSDIDVVVSFSGSEREDDFFNVLHDEKMYFGSIELDINPINTEKTGTLAEYLPGVEKYLSDKSIAIDKSFKDKALALMEKYGYELVAEQGKDKDFTLIRPIGEEEPFGFDGWQMIYDYFCEVDTLVEKNSISELQNRLDGDISQIPLGISDEQLRAAIRFEADQSRIKDFSEKEDAVLQVSKKENRSKQIVTFTVAENSEFHSFGELHEGIPTLQEAMEIYNKMSKESNLNAVPALGINMHIAGSPEYEDVQWDFLTGDRLDLEGLKYLPEMSQNKEIVEALHEIASTFPNVKIIGQFMDKNESFGEKKEPKQLKTVCFEEHKKKRKRVSMKKMLAEKNAELANKPSAEQKTINPQRAGVED